MKKNILRIILITIIFTTYSHASENKNFKFKIDYKKIEHLPDIDVKCNFNEYFTDFYTNNSVFYDVFSNHEYKGKCPPETIKSFYEKIDYSTQDLSVEEAFKKYSSNEYKTQKEFDKQWIMIFGKVEEIALSATNSPVIRLENKDEQFSPAQLNITIGKSNGIKNSYTDQQDGILDKLKKGDSVIIYCERYSFVMKDIIGNDCTVL